MRSLGLILVLSLCYQAHLSHQNATFEDFKDNFRPKRQVIRLPLVFPFGATYKLIIGFITPIHSADYINLVFAVNFQYQYPEIQNITEVSQYYTVNTVSREQRQIDLDRRKDERLTFYKAVEEMLTVKGFNGPECVRKAICEAAQYPVQDEALIGELLHILLTPNYGKTPFEDKNDDWQKAMTDYISAHTAGSQMFDCSFIYALCPEGEGILELISELHDD